MDTQPTRKVRPDAVLRQLPEERQLALFSQLEKTPYAEVRKSLKADGIDVGTTALADFYQFWCVELRFRKAEVQRLEVIARIRVQMPDVTLEEAEAFGDAAFLLSSTAEGDLGSYAKMRKITEGAKRTKLDARRIAILEKKAAQLDKLEATMKDGTLTVEQRQQRMKEVFGIS